MKLTNLQCKNAKPKEKPYKLAAGRGLYLEVMPNGSKYWRMKYRIKVGGKYKERRMAFGVYPEVSIKEAADRRPRRPLTVRSGHTPTLPGRKPRSDVLTERHPLSEGFLSPSPSKEGQTSLVFIEKKENAQPMK
ncbi:MAG: DUF4102 domain-containing protein [Alphaproteobacteria bacterium]|nr:DUF4102 domain-containing protein [Alphaproteobacteria bacterium]